MTGTFRNNPLRSIYWKLHTGCLSSNVGQWLSETQALRDQYVALRQQHVVNPDSGTEEADLALNNPLSTAKESKWAQYFEDNQLCKKIQLDLSRTYPTVDFFQSAPTQNSMLNILFIWSKLHPDYSYRQGMNELLAPVMLVLSREARPASSELVFQLLDEDFIEHDAFHMFDRIMEVMAIYYTKTERSPPVFDEKRKLAESIMGDKIVDEDTDLNKKCFQIHHRLLPLVDAPLYEHLQAVGVQPQLYLLRWVRLLFGQEFHLEDVVVLWDAIFLKATLPLKPGSFPLLDWVAIAMLLYVRQSLMDGDNVTCMRRLLKYPPVEEITVIVQRALTLGTPSRGAQPAAKGFLFRSTHTQPAEDDDGFSEFESHTVDFLKGGAKKIGKFLKHNIHVPSHEPRNPFTGHGSESDRKEIIELKQQAEDMRKMTQAMGQLLETVVIRMHEEYMTTSAAKTPFDENVLLESIAELKHCKDILLGRLSLADYLQFVALQSPIVNPPQIETDADPLAIVVKPSTPVKAPASPASPTSPTSPASPAVAPPKALAARPLSDAAREILDSAEPESSLFASSPRKVDDDDFTARLKSDSVVANPLLADLLG